MPTKPEPAPPEKKDEKKPAAPEKKSAERGPALRTWTDDSGKHYVVARFASILDDGSVRLQRLDGTFVRVARDRLSSADRQYVRAELATLAARN